MLIGRLITSSCVLKQVISVVIYGQQYNQKYNYCRHLGCCEITML